MNTQNSDEFQGIMLRESSRVQKVTYYIVALK